VINELRNTDLISFRNVTRRISTSKNKNRRILSNINWILKEGQRVGIVAKSMQEAHAFLECASGISMPQEGNVLIEANVSWPIGVKGGLSSSLSGRQNARFLAAVYNHGSNQQELVEKIERLADLGEGFFDIPLKNYSKSMRSRFYLAVSLLLSFDVYILPQIFAWKSNPSSKNIIQFQKILKKQTDGKSIIMANVDFNFLERFCNQGLVLDKGSVAYSGSFMECRKWYEVNISKTPEEDFDRDLINTDELTLTNENDVSIDDIFW